MAEAAAATHPVHAAERWAEPRAQGQGDGLPVQRIQCGCKRHAFSHDLVAEFELGIQFVQV